MATRGRIGVLRPDGRVESIYNHYDSHLDGLGEALKKITDPKDIDELIKLGNRRGTYADEDWRDKKSLFDEPSRFFENEEDFFNNNDDDSEYRYLFKDGAWWIGEPDGWDVSVREFYKSPQDLANKLNAGRKTPVRLTNPQAAINGGEGAIAQKLLGSKSKFAQKYPDRYEKLKGHNVYGEGRTAEDVDWDEIATLMGVKLD